MIVARHYRLTGRVQGVGFRLFAYETALREGIQGWVRNLPDGGVEIAAEGESESMRRFEAAIRRGPSGARVEDCEVEIEPATGRYPGFSVRG